MQLILHAMNVPTTTEKHVCMKHIDNVPCLCDGYARGFLSFQFAVKSVLAGCSPKLLST